MAENLLVSRPTYPLRETGILFMALGTILMAVAAASQLDCAALMLFCVVGLFPLAVIFTPIMVVGGFVVTRYHRPPDPSQVAGQANVLTCPVCGMKNLRLSSGFCFRCGAPLPPPY